MVLEQRATITHLLQLGVCVFPPYLLLTPPLVLLVDTPEQCLEGQRRHNPSRGERERAPEPGRIFGRLLLQEDETRYRALAYSSLPKDTAKSLTFLLSLHNFPCRS